MRYPAQVAAVLDAIRDQVGLRTVRPHPALGSQGFYIDGPRYVEFPILIRTSSWHSASKRWWLNADTFQIKYISDHCGFLIMRLQGRNRHWEDSTDLVIPGSHVQQWYEAFLLPLCGDDDPLQAKFNICWDCRDFRLSSLDGEVLSHYANAYSSMSSR